LGVNGVGCLHEFLERRGDSAGLSRNVAPTQNSIRGTHWLTLVLRRRRLRRNIPCADTATRLLCGAQRKMKLDTSKVQNLLENADRYHAAYHRAETFGGPSLYFHRRALATRESPASPQHLEYVYATLSSWGMHRMGPGGSKMRAFDEFRASVEPLEEKIVKAQRFVPSDMNEDAWGALKDIFFALRIMASGTSLVGHSKVMHHMLPNIVPPIDREYTLRYLYGNTMIANDIGKEWLTMREIISGFFVPVVADPAFVDKAQGWIAAGNPWDTSLLKVIDNLLIGSRRPYAA
jgi:hypothetical protein